MHEWWLAKLPDQNLQVFYLQTLRGWRRSAVPLLIRAVNRGKKASWQKKTTKKTTKTTEKSIWLWMFSATLCSDLCHIRIHVWVHSRIVLDFLFTFIMMIYMGVSDLLVLGDRGKKSEKGKEIRSWKGIENIRRKGKSVWRARDDRRVTTIGDRGFSASDSVCRHQTMPQKV